LFFTFFLKFLFIIILSGWNGIRKDFTSYYITVDYFEAGYIFYFILFCFAFFFLLILIGPLFFFFVLFLITLMCISGAPMTSKVLIVCPLTLVSVWNMWLLYFFFNILVLESWI
jgi:hypothetical protein